MTRFIETFATFPKLLLATAAAVVGAKAGGTEPISQIHWLQLTVWAMTAFGGFCTGIVGLIGAWKLWKEIKKL